MNYKELLETYKATRRQYGFKDPLTKYYANLIICICTGKDHKAVIKWLKSSVKIYINIV